MQFTLAHLSDIHFGPLPPVKRRQLLSKRITGYVNWQRNRGASMGPATLAALTDALEAIKPDHIAITGDLTNLGLPAEFETTAAWLAGLGPAEGISIVPGNHDAYVRHALQKGLRQWAPWVTGDSGVAPKENQDFPYQRVRDHVQIIGCSSAVATPVFVAAGRFGRRQAHDLAASLREGREKGLFRIVLIHHPPVWGAASRAQRLYGITRFQSVIQKEGAELILHGHTHLPQRHFINGPDGKVPVYGVPAASQAPGGHKPAAAFNLFKISAEKNGAHSCHHEEWSITTIGGSAEITDENRLY
ncbi:MAG: metallophosphoesterase [Pseudomonadota bacterium]